MNFVSSSLDPNQKVVTRLNETPSTFRVQTLLEFGHVNYVNVPASPYSPGNVGDIAYDTNYVYIYTDGIWKRSAISNF
jgi:hypothetical protein